MLPIINEIKNTLMRNLIVIAKNTALFIFDAFTIQMKYICYDYEMKYEFQIYIYFIPVVINPFNGEFMMALENIL